MKSLTVKSLTVAQKIFFGFGLVITLTVLVGVVGILGMMQINSGSREMFERQSQPLADLGVAREYFQRLRVQLRDMVLASGNTAELEFIEASLNEYEQGFIKYMEAYRPTIITPAAIEIYYEIMAAFNEYQPHIQQIMTSAKVNAPPVQMSIMLSVLTGPTNFIMEALDYLAYERVLQAAYVNEVNNFWFNALLITIITVIAVSISVALVLTQRLSGQISRPLVEIGNFAGKVSSGKINMAEVSENSIDVRSGDEIGALARILEKSYIQLNKYEQSKILLRQLEADNASLESLNRMKTEFFKNLNHDLKTPLTVVSVGVADAADMLDFEFDEKVMREILKNTQKETMRIARMMNNAMGNTTLNEERRDMARIDITPLLRESSVTYRALLERKGNTLSLDIPQPLPFIFGDSDLLLHVFSNLLSNANRYTKNSTISINAVVEDGKIVVRIKDTGSGVKPELLPHIFKRGVSEDGTGLGLPICKAAIEAHNGTITVESEYGQGTTVSFSIPIIKDSQQERSENG
ncbi:MAG: MCP four helix bundle domain-containing protein [Spirochaetaceae bacterium]|nr:MCP four helix bundle domain-containing protein [Spirochaetaceae bacterium]